MKEEILARSVGVRGTEAPGSIVVEEPAAVAVELGSP